jgi:5-methylcytosine-specific restriction endonuclease McrA
MQALGAFCKFCRATDNLTFDCIIPTGDKHHKMSSRARMTFYIGQARRGNLQVLCENCNRLKSDGPQPRYVVARTVSGKLPTPAKPKDHFDGDALSASSII